MIRDQLPIIQAFLGTLFTWALTGAGAALVFCFSSPKVLYYLFYYYANSIATLFFTKNSALHFIHHSSIFVVAYIGRLYYH